MRATVVGGLWLAVALSTATAWGQTASDGEYTRAARLRRDQQLEEALAVYEQISAQTHDPRALAQRGFTEAQMGRWVAAEEHLLAALATDDRWVRHNRGSVQQALESVRGHVADLVVTSNVGGAALRVNGVPAGTLPRATPVRVARGPVVIEVAAEHYEVRRQTVQVNDPTSRVEATLVAEAVGAVVATPPRGTVAPPVVAEPVATVVPVAAVIPPPTRVEAATGGPLPALRVTAFALGAVGVGLGVAGLLLRQGAADSFANAGCGTENLGAQPAGCQSDYDTVQSMQAMEIAGFVAGGVFVAAGAVLLFVGPSASREQRTAWACGQGPGTIGLSCGGRF
jgi:hypothetical protein